MLIALALMQHVEFSSGIIMLMLPLLSLIFIIELFRKKDKPFLNIGITLLGIIYITLPIMLFSMIGIPVNDPGNYRMHLVLGFFIILWSSDTGAYLAGMKFGKHKLFERISPKKTWEGSIGGTALALTVAWILSRYFPELSLNEWLVFAFIIVVFGSLGDLAESLLKRSLNVKDSGSILPGHGGALDRFDGLFGAAPFVFLYLYFL